MGLPKELAFAPYIVLKKCSCADSTALAFFALPVDQILNSSTALDPHIATHSYVIARRVQKVRKKPPTTHVGKGRNRACKSG